MSNKHDVARQMGRDAYHLGLPRMANPYSNTKRTMAANGTRVLAKAWLAGYDEASLRV